MKRVYHFRPRRTTVLPLTGSLAFVLASLWLLWCPHNPLYRIAAVAGLLFFGFCFLLLLRALLCRRNDEAVVLTSAACTIADPLGHRVVLPWREIERFEPLDLRGQSFVALVPRDAEKVLDRASGRIARRLMRWNRSCAGTPVAISMQSVDADRAELLATLRDHLHRYSH